MRAAAVQLNSNEDTGPQPGDRGAPGPPRRRRGRGAGRAAREVQRARHARAAGRRRRAARRARRLHGRGALAARAGSLAGRRQHRRARASDGRLRNTSALLSPDGRARSPSTARSTCSTSRSRASPTASPRSRRPARRSWSPTPAELTLGLAVCYDLRFPELFRIMAVARRARLLAAGGFHGADRAGALGGAGARARDREPGVRDRRRAGRAAIRGDHESYGHSMIVDPWGTVLAAAARRARAACVVGRPRPGRAGRDAREAARRLPTAARRPIAGPSRLERAR